MHIFNYVFYLIPIVMVGVFGYFIYIAIKHSRADAKRNEALFQSLFPDLQPHFHPERLHEFVKAWRARKPMPLPYSWDNPPGFTGAAKADFAPDPKGQKVRVLDAAGAPLAQFVLESHAEGAAMRVGPGKFTVNIQNANDPRVRYWHPKREFKWSKLKGWRFVTPMSDESIDSNDSGTSFSRDSSSYSSSTATAAAAAAGVAGLGGTFDGGGASAGWEDGGSGSSSDSGGGESSGSVSPAY